MQGGLGSASRPPRLALGGGRHRDNSQEPPHLLHLTPGDALAVRDPALAGPWWSRGVSLSLSGYPPTPLPVTCLRGGGYTLLSHRLQQTPPLEGGRPCLSFPTHNPLQPEGEVPRSPRPPPNFPPSPGSGGAGGAAAELFSV